MPQRIDRCVESVLANPDFEPQDPKQDKESAAYALCTWMDQQGWLEDSEIDKKVYVCKCDKCGHWERGETACAGKSCPEPDCDGTMRAQTTLPLAGEEIPIVYSDSQQGTVMELTLKGPFKIVLPIVGAKRMNVEKDEGIETELWLHVEASGPERDSDKDRMSDTALEKFVTYAQKSPISFLDGHYRDLLSAMLGDIYNPHLTEQKHFAFDVLLKNQNPFAVQLFEDVLAGKKHGASIAGIVHAADLEETADGWGRVFHDVELIEVSRTSWPSWRPSFITLLASHLGKVGEADYQAILKRREDIQNLTSCDECKEVNEMGKDTIVQTDDGGTEVWTENEQGEMVAKITSPHGWDQKFTVSDVSWASITDRSKPCQFAIIKTLEDGGFSKSKSGYPHHHPNCTTINRGGTINAGVRLIQAMKSEMPMIDIPPILSLAEAAGIEIEKQVSRFSREELVYAANHILKHYRRDLEMEPPENLVAVAKTVDYNDPEQVAEIVKGLVQVVVNECKKLEAKSMSEEIIQKTPVTEVLEEQVEEITTEPEIVAETAPEAIVKQEVEGEPQKILANRMSGDSTLLAHQFSTVLFHTQEAIAEAVQAHEVQKAKDIVDEFAEMAKSMITSMEAMDTTGLSFLKAFEERIELTEGRLSKNRVGRLDTHIETLIADLLSARELMKNAQVADDEIIQQVAEKVQQDAEKQKSAYVQAMEARITEMEQKRKAELDALAEVLAEPEPEKPAPVKSEERPTPSEQDNLEIQKSIFLKSVSKKR